MFVGSCVAEDYTSTKSLRDTVKLSVLDESRSRRSLGGRDRRFSSTNRPPPMRLIKPIAEEYNETTTRNRNSSETGTDIRDIFFGGGQESVDRPHGGGAGGPLCDRAYIEESPYSVGWVFDDESTACMRCDLEFSLMRRRHHCRKCGILVCHSCSSYNMPVFGLKPGLHRVCEDCFELEQNRPTFNSSSRSPFFIRGLINETQPVPPKPPPRPSPKTTAADIANPNPRTRSVEP